MGQTREAWPESGTRHGRIDSDTSCLQPSSSPGSCGSPADLADLESALGALKAEAFNFAKRFIQDGGVRQDYLRKTEAMARMLREEVQAGRLSARDAAQEAQTLRNGIMDAARLKSSDIGRAKAEALKPQGKTLAELEQHYARRLFKGAFEELTQAQKNQVWMEIVEASGRPNPAVSAKALRLAKAGRALMFLSVAIAVYNVATAEDKGKQAAKEGVGLGAAIAGGAAGGALAGLACGPGAPVCVTIGVFVGGALAAFGSDYVFESWW